MSQMTTLKLIAKHTVASKSWFAKTQPLFPFFTHTHIYIHIYICIYIYIIWFLVLIWWFSITYILYPSLITAPWWCCTFFPWLVETEQSFLEQLIDGTYTILKSILIPYIEVMIYLHQHVPRLLCSGFIYTTKKHLLRRYLYLHSKETQISHVEAFIDINIFQISHVGFLFT